jgi:uncharacterized protein (TIGR03000 family)
MSPRRVSGLAAVLFGLSSGSILAQTGQAPPYRPPLGVGTQNYRAPLQPGTEGYRAPQQPGTEGYRAPLQPGTECYRAPLQPGTEGYRAPLQPGTTDYRAPLQPGTTDYRAPLQPGTDRVYRAPLQPGTEGVYQAPLGVKEGGQWYYWQRPTSAWTSTNPYAAFANPSAPVRRANDIHVVLSRADAKVSLNGVEMTGTGLSRHLAVNGVANGSKNEYTITATWTENGKPVTKSQVVHLDGTGHALADFR